MGSIILMRQGFAQHSKGCVRVIRVGVSKVQLFEELGMSSALQGCVLRQVRCPKVIDSPDARVYR